MVESVDTKDLKSFGQKWLCGFKSHSRYNRVVFVMKLHKVLTLILTIVVLCTSTTMVGQVSFNPAYARNTMHRISVGIDALYYYGDVYPVVEHPMSLPPRGDNMGFNINVGHTYQVIPSLGLRTTLSGGLLRGAANDQSYSYWVERGKTPKMGSALNDAYSVGRFKSYFGEVDFGVEWYPIPHREGGLYIYVGVGLHVSGIYCDFANANRNPQLNPVSGQPNLPGWRAGILPMAIGELGYSFRLADGHTLSIKGSLHNGLLNVNSRNPKVGYNLDGWGRGAADKADFTYNPVDKSNRVGQTALGQFTDGYFTFGIAYTFDAGGEPVPNRLSASSHLGRSKSHKSYSPRVNKYNPRAATYKAKVSKSRNKAFIVKRKRR